MSRLAALALTVVLCSLPACKKAEPDEGGSSTGGVPASPQPTVAERIQGYWLPSKDSLLEMALADLEASAPPGGVTADMTAQVRAQIEASAGAFILHFEEGKTRALADDRVETGTYELSDVDEAAGTFTATMAEDGGQTVVGAGEIKGDSMKLRTGEGEPPMELTRANQAEWDRRMDALNGVGN